MSLNEIEIAGSSISVKIWDCDIEDIQATFQRIMQEGDQFLLDSEIPGFHDCDTDGELIRGYFSGIIPFEVEHLVEGISTKTLFKRIESCEFIATKNYVFTTGRPGPMKGLSLALCGLTGSNVSLTEFEFDQMNQLQERMTKLKSIVLTNPKDKEVRRARLAGHIESYIGYNIIDPRNHGIDSVAGIMDTPLGPLTATVGKKGSLRLSVRKGFILTTECLEWIVSLIKEKQAPGPVNAPQSVF